MKFLIYSPKSELSFKSTIVYIISLSLISPNILYKIKNGILIYLYLLLHINNVI